MDDDGDADGNGAYDDEEGAHRGRRDRGGNMICNPIRRQIVEEVIASVRRYLRFRVLYMVMARVLDG